MTPILVLALACGRERASVRQVGQLPVHALESVALVPRLPPISMRWPQFLAVEASNRFVWGGARDIYRINTSRSGPTLDGPIWPELTEGLSRIIAMARTPEGTIALLDSEGHVKGLSPGSKTPWSFVTHMRNAPGALAIADHSAFLLMQGEDEGGAAVVAYDLFGQEKGRWDEMPATGIIQARLTGGGIAACPDGSIYYSYINSPRISALNAGSGSVRLLGTPPLDFEVLSAERVRDAYRESERSHSVAPLVRLGLRGSRVTALLCSQEGLLFRQVVEPEKGGSHVEVWAPGGRSLLGAIPCGSGVLLAIRDSVLYLGRAQTEGFILDRLEYRMPGITNGKERR